MSRKARHAKPSAAAKVSRTAVIGGAAAAVTVGTVVVGAGVAGASPLPLPVTLSADGNGSAGFSAHGVPELSLGSTGTFAELTVNLKALGQHLAPAAPPAFTTDNYGAGSPRWVIELANGNWVDGYPAQLGAGAKADFTGAQWAVGNSGTYESYAAALAGANDALGNVKVTSAYIVEDADQAPGTTDTLAGVQYGGEMVGAGQVTVSPAGAETVTAGTAVTPVTVRAVTTASDKTVTYTAAGLPAGLGIDPASGVISGTVKAAAVSITATVTATDAYGDTGTASIAFTVTRPAVIPVVSHGRVVSVSATGATVAWNQTVTSTDNVRITGPGPINGHTGTTKNDQAVYRGLEPGHTYEVWIQPTVSGKAIGQLAHITLRTNG
jgi:hypothetical protein